MPVRPNLTALPGLRSGPFQGTVHRIVPHILKDKLLSTEGNRSFPGRYHLAGETGILYTSLTEDLAIREIGRHAPSQALQGGLIAGQIRIRLQQILDLTRADNLSKLGLTREALVSRNHSITHAISVQARRAGFQGMLVPSAMGEGTNLVVFENNLGEGCLIEIEDVRPL